MFVDLLMEYKDGGVGSLILFVFFNLLFMLYDVFGKRFFGGSGDLYL